MNKQQRVEYFERLLKKDPYAFMELYYKSHREKMKVYEIDLDYLVYNPYNGRIASRVKSYEKQEGKTLNPEDTEDIRIIERFLDESSKESNKNTYESLKSQGQLRYGIVTKDGYIIDGNRRALLLRRVAEKKKEHPGYFLAVVLDEELHENPKEIMRLETTFQMGEDAKVDYDPIEKYLKCQDLVDYYPGEQGIQDIAQMMGENPPEIKKYISIMKLMEEYLEKTGNSGIYTRLNKTEGAFVDLNGYLNRYKDGKSKIVKWKYDASDLNDLKLIYFDYIRAIYNKTKGNDGDEGIMDNGDSKDYRFIGQTSKRGSFFGSKEIWEEFRDNHFESIEPIREKFVDGDFAVDELRQKHSDEKLDRLLEYRDEAWAKQAAPPLKRNLGQSRYRLELKNQKEAPMDLLKRAKNTLESIDVASKAFLEDPDVLNMVKEINSIIWDFQKRIKHAKEV
ncbi:MAG: hypothetical protein WCF84_20620 [Anaerolineae bacterium]